MKVEGVEIVGWGHTRFGKLNEESLESLIVSAAKEALEFANVGASEIDDVYLGTYNAGMQAIAFPSSLTLEADDALRFVSATRVENACATGSAAIAQGIRAILSGAARRVLVVGAEKMTATARETVGRALLGADYDRAGETAISGFAELFAEVARAYFEKYGDASEAMARIAAKSHRNGVANPYAQLRSDLGFDYCNTVGAHNPMVAAPLRRTDCSPISDGAAAVVLAAPGAAPSGSAVGFRAAAQANDFFPAKKRDPLAFLASHVAWQRAMGDSGMKVSDLGLVEVHDCFTIAELIEYEVIGLCPPGGGVRIIEEGIVEKTGSLPVNPSGGLKAKGHPVGATGVSQHVMAAMQLTGNAGEMQVPETTVAGIFNMGGMAVANYVSILERIR